MSLSYKSFSWIGITLLSGNDKRFIIAKHFFRKMRSDSIYEFLWMLADLLEEEKEQHSPRKHYVSTSCVLTSPPHPPNFRPLTGSVRATDCPVGCHTAPRSWAALDSVGAGGGLTCDSGEASLCPRQAPGTVGIVYVASARPEQTFSVFPVGVGSGCKTHCLSKEGNPFSGC